MPDIHPSVFDAAAIDLSTNPLATDVAEAVADADSALAAAGSAQTAANTANTTANNLKFYDIGAGCMGKPAASAIILIYKLPRAVNFGANMAGSYAVAATAATASTVFTVYKNAVQVATITFAASATTGTYSGTANFAAGDNIGIVAPGTQDSTLADIGFSLAGVIP
jgi:hypothetical protein